jgi:hypothetical protein
VADIETLVAEIEELADGEARQKARAVVRALLDLHRAGLAGVLDALRRSGGDAAVVDVAREDAVSGLLLLHGLHPVGAEARARSALASVGPALRAMKASVEILGVAGDVLRVRVQGPGPALRGATTAVEEALCAAAPDLFVETETAPASAPEAIVPVGRLLARAAARRDGESERCELCGAAIHARHDHLVDPRARELKCACGACATLFAATGDGRWKRVPRRAELLADFRLTEDAWGALGIPIDLAFFYRSSTADRVLAFYPGPAGATESLLSLDAWSRMEADNPKLRELATDVEALLVRRSRGDRECYRVSIDECYALVGHLRRHWRGLSGGAEAWTRIGAFFDDLKRGGQVAVA